MPIRVEPLRCCCAPLALLLAASAALAGCDPGELHGAEEPDVVAELPQEPPPDLALEDAEPPAPDSDQPDAEPAPPPCPCFVKVAWCGSGVAKEAKDRGCTVPLLPAHRGDILHCPSGQWAVKERCAEGCVEAPSGSPDYCDGSGTSPVPGYRITTPFGKPGSWAAGYHTGDDYAAPTGTRVVATRGGKVVSSTWGSAYGNLVVIESAGVRHGYAHLSAKSVSVGQQVERGQQIGKVGSTGNSTGPHLHYEERTSPYGYGDHRKPQLNR